MTVQEQPQPINKAGTGLSSVNYAYEDYVFVRVCHSAVSERAFACDLFGLPSPVLFTTVLFNQSFVRCIITQLMYAKNVDSIAQGDCASIYLQDTPISQINSVGEQPLYIFSISQYNFLRTTSDVVIVREKNYYDC